MTARLTALTPEQQAQLKPYADQWIQRGWRTGRLTDAEWADWEDGARRCYKFAGIPFPGVVVHVPSPLVGAFAAPIADALIQRREAVHGAVDGAVHGAVHGAVDGAVRGAVDGAVRGAVDGAVGEAVHGAVGEAVRGAVDGAVGEAVHGAVGEAVRYRWYYYLGGQWWGAWQAWRCFFRDHCETSVSDDIWDLSRAYEATMTAGWWWPFRDFVMVADRPDLLRLERVGPDGWGSHRLHSEHGPAISWATDALYYWHGTRIPRDPDEIRTMSTADVLRESNTEVRRAMIEIAGWPSFIDSAKFKQVGADTPDPGNPGQVLRLYDIPERIYNAPVRVLVAVNGSVERDGTRRTYGLTVPADISDPLSAAAWGYGLTPETYADCEVRR